MALTSDQLQALLNGAGFSLTVMNAPNGGPFCRLGFRGVDGVAYQVLILVLYDGTVLRLRSTDFLFCPATHPHFNAVLKAMASINYKVSLAKFSCDENDGEIAVYLDTVLVDSTVTPNQLARQLDVFSGTLETNGPRLRRIMETGQDPAETPAPAAAAPPTTGGGISSL